MWEISNLRDPVLINTIGHSAGVLLFGLIIFLLIRDWRAHGVRRTKLSIAAALLALGWNVGSLVALALPAQQTVWLGIVLAYSFSVLSLLPAVLLQVVLQGKSRAITVAGYAVSSVAILLHGAELFAPHFGFHQIALVLIAGGFGLLTVVAFLARRRVRPDKQADFSEWISLGCLLLFATSFLHFGYQHISSPWGAEITWHHIGIPVALIVLLQDYRFLLLDTFIRFLVNFGMAAVYIAALFTLSHGFRRLDSVHLNAFWTGVCVVGFCLSLILFAYLRNGIQAWVSRVVFRRRSVDECIQRITSVGAAVHSEEELLTRAAAEVARHLHTDRFAVSTRLESDPVPERPSVLFKTRRHGEDFSVEARIPLRFSSGDLRYLVAGSRRGGRRYLSEDLEDMRRLGAVIVEQVERFRAEELRRLVSQAEFRALQAQINPHFLFNALNTLYGTIDRRSQEARRMVLNLADIFRYFLQGDRVTIQLSEELKIIQAYLEIEKLRLGDRLETQLTISESAQAVMIPILSIQPLVENAVKHGIAAKEGPGRVSLTAESNGLGLRVTVEDTGIGFEESGKYSRNGSGVGLENVRRRLALCYGQAAALEIQSTAAGSRVTFFIPNQPDTQAIEQGSAEHGLAVTA
jgi:two-component system, LytTR family, sensor kinase